jgi:hypothetical protein
MTGGGLLGLVAYGSQNVVLSGNPDMTYFYKVFRRYTHFAMESIAQQMDGPDQLFYDQPIKVRFKIPRIGDLVSDMYFTFQLPDIYSKYISPRVRSYQYEFQWSKYIGCALIQNAAFFIGGQKIQEFDGSYLLAKALADYKTDEFAKWERLVGNVAELVDPANGIYAGGTNQTGYPSVIRDPSRPLGSQLNRPSLFGQTIRVPLPFWFAENAGSALPLVGLQYHECEVQLTLNPINQLYTVLDASGFRVAPGIQTSASLANIRSNLPDYTSIVDISGQIRAFLTDMGADVPALNTWNLQPTIETTYIYLAEEERTLFATTPLSYLIHQLTWYPFPTIYTRQILDLETHNPIERLLFVNRRSDTLQYRNDFSNWTNWWNYPSTPYLPPPGTVPLLTQAFSSGVLIQFAQLQILQGLRVLCDGNEIQEIKPIDYFTKITPWKYTSGNPGEVLPIYSFCLHSPDFQPSGSLNSSRIRVFQVEVNPYTLPPNTTYVYDLTIYVESVNFVEFAAGMAGLKYAL